MNATILHACVTRLYLCLHAADLHLRFSLRPLLKNLPSSECKKLLDVDPFALVVLHEPDENLRRYVASQHTRRIAFKLHEYHPEFVFHPNFKDVRLWSWQLVLKDSGHHLFDSPTFEMTPDEFVWYFRVNLDHMSDRIEQLNPLTDQNSVRLNLLLSTEPWMLKRCKIEDIQRWNDQLLERLVQHYIKTIHHNPDANAECWRLIALKVINTLLYSGRGCQAAPENLWSFAPKEGRLIQFIGSIIQHNSDHHLSTRLSRAIRFYLDVSEVINTSLQGMYLHISSSDETDSIYPMSAVVFNDLHVFFNIENNTSEFNSERELSRYGVLFNPDTLLLMTSEHAKEAYKKSGRKPFYSAYMTHLKRFLFQLFSSNGTLKPLSATMFGPSTLFLAWYFRRFVEHYPALSSQCPELESLSAVELRCVTELSLFLQRYLPDSHSIHAGMSTKG